MRALRTVPCATCGRLPTDIFRDGSPRYDHGHDPLTGETWWVAGEVESDRTCPVCRHGHFAGTTCRRCEACRALDLVPQAEEIFGDLLPGGSDVYGALLRHDHNLGLYAACDGSCALADCRRPYFDDAGLTRCQDGPMTAGPTAVYPQSAWEIDR